MRPPKCPKDQGLGDFDEPIDEPITSQATDEPLTNQSRHKPIIIDEPIIDESMHRKTGALVAQTTEIQATGINHNMCRVKRCALVTGRNSFGSIKPSIYDLRIQNQISGLGTNLKAGHESIFLPTYFLLSNIVIN